MKLAQDEINSWKVHNNRFMGLFPPMSLPRVVQLQAQEIALYGDCAGPPGFCPTERTQVGWVNAHGAFPDTISPGLVLLSLPDNLSGTLPSVYGNETITQLATGNSCVSGSIPAGLFDLPSLHAILLRHHPSGTASCLSISGTIPHSSGARRTNQVNPLEYWNLVGMLSVSGTVPAHFEQFSKLVNAYFADARLSGTLPNLAKWGNIEDVSFKGVKLSGTLAQELLLPNCTALWFYNLPLSGTLPSGVAGLSSLQDMYLYSANYSGSIPGEWSALTSLEHLFLHENRISGTVDHQLAHLSLLETFSIGVNYIEGTIPEDFRNLTNMKSCMVYDNKALSIDLRTVHSWPQLQHLAVQTTATSGTIPEDILSNTSNIASFLIASTLVSGTLPAGLFSGPRGLSSFDASSNSISGHVPINSVNKFTKGLLLNAMRLSGSISASNSAADRISNRSDFKSGNVTISAARNTFAGTIPKEFEFLTSLKTLILSGNRFSCYAPDMDNAVNLGKDTFEEPVVSALKEIGEAFVLGDIKIRTNQFADLSGSYHSAVTVFAGNSALQSGASLLPGQPASLLSKMDQKQLGKVPLFENHSNFKQFFWITLPGALIVHIVVTALVVSWKWPNEPNKLRRYLANWRPIKPVGKYRLALTVLSKLRATWIVMGLLYISAVGLLANAFMDKVYSHPECIDPLMWISLTTVSTSTFYQWIWTVMCCGTLTVQGAIACKLRRVPNRANAKCHQLLLVLSHRAQAVADWKSKVRPISTWRRLAAYAVLRGLTITAASLPTFAFILVPTHIHPHIWLTIF